MDKTEKPITQEYKYKGKILNLRVDNALMPNGRQSLREVVEHNGGVTVAALTEKGEIVLVRQFRYPYMTELLETPAGKLEKGESPFAAGVRELREETGADAQKYYELGVFYPSTGYCAEKIYLYAADGLNFSEQDLDEDEFIDIVTIPLEKAVDMILNGEIRDGKTQALVLKVSALLKSGRLSEFEIEDWREKI